MNEDLRDRAFLPIVMPVLAVAGFIGFAFALSRVLLAVPEAASTVIGITVAAYILFVAALVAARPRISSRALGIGLALGLVGVGAAGVLAASAGMRPVGEEEEVAAEGQPAPEQPTGQTIPPDALVFVAEQLAFSQAPPSAPAGQVTVALENNSGLPHNVVFEGVDNDEPVVETGGNETNTGTVTLQPGTVTFYCGVPGHREAGMEGRLTVG